MRILFIKSVPILITIIVGVCPIWSQQDKPITKTGLTTALKHKDFSEAGIIGQVENRGVNFQLDAVVENDIRLNGKYLGKKGLDRLIAVVRRNYRTAAMSLASPSPIPSKPDWKESEEAKGRAAEMLRDIQSLIDQGKKIKVIDYAAAVKDYRDWAEECSTRLGILDSKMRDFGQSNSNYKEDFDVRSPRICDLNRPSEDNDKAYLKQAIKANVDALGKIFGEVDAHITVKDNSRPELESCLDILFSVAPDLQSSFRC